jgi:TPR repeat protein
MYAEGDGVAEDRLKAFHYFSRIADRHADDNPQSPHAPFVANAFVALGIYYRDGIPGTDVKPDISRAVNLFTYAASYFGDADAQHELGRLYLEGEGVARDLMRAARWLTLAARKNHRGAQATLGDLLFRGEGTLRHVTRGLTWLELARRAAVGRDKWILRLHERAFAQAPKADRDRALEMADAFARRVAKENAPAARDLGRTNATAADTSVRAR